MSSEHFCPHTTIYVVSSSCLPYRCHMRHKKYTRLSLLFYSIEAYIHLLIMCTMLGVVCLSLLCFLHMISLSWFLPDLFILIPSPSLSSTLSLLSLSFPSPLLFSFTQLWRLPFAQVLFDSDPSTTGKTEPQQVEEMSQAMIRCVDEEEDRVMELAVVCW